MRLLKYLNEFNKAFDNDWYGKSNFVVVFNEKDPYKLRKFTHGGVSHAIKHLEDFRPGDYNNLVKRIKNFIKKTEYVVKDRNGKIQPTNIIDNGTIINTMDRVNDKIETKTPLTTEEKFIKTQLEALFKFYQDEITKFKVGAVDVTNMSTYDIQQNINNNKTLMIKPNKKFTYYVNLKNLGFLVVGKKKGPITFFKRRNKQEIIQKIKEIVSDKQEIIKAF